MEDGTRQDGPAMRLMRLWLWTAPLVMLALAAMVVLALVAVGLFAVQWRLLRGLREQ